MNIIKPGAIIKMIYGGEWRTYELSSNVATVKLNPGDVGLILQQFLSLNNNSCWLILIKQQMVYIKEEYFKVMGNI